RTLFSGVEGVHWDMVDGKPKLREETLAMKKAGGAEWSQSGISLDLNLIGLGGTTIDPDTSSPIDLFATDEALASSATPLELDFSSHCGGKHPGDVLSKLIQEGKLIDSNTIVSQLTTEQRITEGKVGL